MMVAQRLRFLRQPKLRINKSLQKNVNKKPRTARLLIFVPVRTIVVLFGVAISPGIFARTASDSIRAETPDAISWLLLNDIIAPDAADLISETLSDLLARPYDLSKPDENTLRLIPTLTELETMKLRLVRNARTEDDIRRILSNKLYDRSRPFLSLVTPPQHTLEARSRIGADPNATNEEEYAESKYDGSPLKSSNLVRLYSEYLTAGFIQSKDAGEQLFLDHAGGFLSLARPITLSESIAVRNAIIGDYSIGYGEGLLFVRGYARSKSADAISPLGINATGIGGYLSTSAYRFYRGAAAALQFDHLSLDVFYSNRFIDATLTDSGTVTSLSYTGYHRTESEKNRRLSAKQITNGANLGYTVFDDDNARLALSATGYMLSYDRNVLSSDTLKTRFSGTSLIAGSLSFAAYFGNYALRGEAARSISDGAEANALTASLLAKPFERWEFAANFRVLPEAFLSPLGGTFGDNASDVQNETGGYIGFRTFIGDEIMLEGYSDISSRVERTPTNENLLATRDFRLSASWSKADAPLRLSLESRFRIREELTSSKSDTIEQHDKFNIKFRPDYTFSEIFRAALDLQFVSYGEPGADASGYLAGSTIYYHPFVLLNIAVSADFFSTDTYDSRIYISEPEAPGVASFNFLYGDGFRYSLLLSANPIAPLKLYAKLSETIFHSPSTDADERRSYLTFQAEFRL